MIHNSRHFGVGRNGKKVRLELIALRQLHQVQLIGGGQLLQHDRHFPTIRRGCVVKINHGMPARCYCASIGLPACDRLDLLEIFNSHGAPFAAVAGLLVSAKW